MEQKLVTVHLISRGQKQEHKTVEEHLQNYLDAGWMISSVSGIGGANESGYYATGWIIVLLEKSSPLSR